MLRSDRVLLFSIAIIILLVVSECSYLMELTALKKCDFRLGTLENPELAGINISEITSIEDLGITEFSKITGSILSGKLPLSFTLNIEVKNPNKHSASLHKLEYIAFIDDFRVAEGEIDKRVEIASGNGIASVPLNVKTDLLALMTRESRNALINFGLNLADLNQRPTRITLKIKPYIRIGKKDIIYPGYINVKEEFSSSD